MGTPWRGDVAGFSRLVFADWPLRSGEVRDGVESVLTREAGTRGGSKAGVKCVVRVVRVATVRIGKVGRWFHAWLTQAQRRQVSNCIKFNRTRAAQHFERLVLFKEFRVSFGNFQVFER